MEKTTKNNKNTTSPETLNENHSEPSTTGHSQAQPTTKNSNNPLPNPTKTTTSTNDTYTAKVTSDLMSDNVILQYPDVSTDLLNQMETLLKLETADPTPEGRTKMHELANQLDEILEEKPKFLAYIKVPGSMRINIKTLIYLSGTRQKDPLVESAMRSNQFDKLSHERNKAHWTINLEFFSEASRNRIIGAQFEIDNRFYRIHQPMISDGLYYWDITVDRFFDLAEFREACWNKGLPLLTTQEPTGVYNGQRFSVYARRMIFNATKPPSSAFIHNILPNKLRINGRTYVIQGPSFMKPLYSGTNIYWDLDHENNQSEHHPSTEPQNETSSVGSCTSQPSNGNDQDTENPVHDKDLTEPMSITQQDPYNDTVNSDAKNKQDQPIPHYIDETQLDPLTTIQDDSPTSPSRSIQTISTLQRNIIESKSIAITEEAMLKAVANLVPKDTSGITSRVPTTPSGKKGSRFGSERQANDHHCSPSPNERKKSRIPIEHSSTPMDITKTLFQHDPTNYAKQQVMTITPIQEIRLQDIQTALFQIEIPTYNPYQVLADMENDSDETCHDFHITPERVHLDTRHDKSTIRFTPKLDELTSAVDGNQTIATPEFQICQYQLNNKGPKRKAMIRVQKIKPHSAFRKQLEESMKHHRPIPNYNKLSDIHELEAIAQKKIAGQSNIDNMVLECGNHPIVNLGLRTNSKTIQNFLAEIALQHSISRMMMKHQSPFLLTTMNRFGGLLKTNSSQQNFTHICIKIRQLLHHPSRTEDEISNVIQHDALALFEVLLHTIAPDYVRSSIFVQVSTKSKISALPGSSTSTSFWDNATLFQILKSRWGEQTLEYYRSFLTNSNTGQTLLRLEQQPSSQHFPPIAFALSKAITL